MQKMTFNADNSLNYKSLRNGLMSEWNACDRYLIRLSGGHDHGGTEKHYYTVTVHDTHLDPAHSMIERVLFSRLINARKSVKNAVRYYSDHADRPAKYRGLGFEKHTVPSWAIFKN